MQCKFHIAEKAVDFFLENRYNNSACDASVAQSVVHLTRNEKVACSSHVTSSIKTSSPHGLDVFIWWCERTRNIKYDCPEDSRLLPAGRQQLHNFLQKQKMQTSQVTSTKPLISQKCNRVTSLIFYTSKTPPRSCGGVSFTLLHQFRESFPGCSADHQRFPGAWTHPATVRKDDRWQSSRHRPSAPMYRAAG